MSLDIWLPLLTVSEANMREHWAVKAKRKKQHTQVAAMLTRSAFSGVVGKPPLPLCITLTRHGKRRLDPDNLAGSFKGIQDGIAKALGVDDGDERLTWVYDQRKGCVDLGVRVSIERKAKGATG